MNLNLSLITAACLLELVDDEADATILSLKQRSLVGLNRHNTIVWLQHMGIVKHRLEHGLGHYPVFRGPIEWGHPMPPSRNPLPFK